MRWKMARIEAKNKRRTRCRHITPQELEIQGSHAGQRRLRGKIGELPLSEQIDPSAGLSRHRVESLITRSTRNIAPRVISSLRVNYVALGTSSIIGSNGSSRPRRESGRTSTRASSTVCFGHHRRLRRLDDSTSGSAPKPHTASRIYIDAAIDAAPSPIVWQRCVLCSVLLRKTIGSSHADQGRVRRLQRSGSSHVQPQTQQVATPFGLWQRRSLQSRQPRVFEQLRLGRRHHQAGQVVQVLQGHLRLAQEQRTSCGQAKNKHQARFASTRGTSCELVGCSEACVHSTTSRCCSGDCRKRAQRTKRDRAILNKPATRPTPSNSSAITQENIKLD
ncbi:unnamed protein product [Trichogramma brassicae]|uniref:Uncharacterized protein n=1 Tax=Trichogramma brassicae TaxID=86971 RepID=A0A6H5I7R1_9HYME|nr:unnamed protein product [Trichogramma brassicae]